MDCQYKLQLKTHKAQYLTHKAQYLTHKAQYPVPFHTLMVGTRAMRHNIAAASCTKLENCTKTCMQLQVNFTSAFVQCFCG